MGSTSTDNGIGPRNPWIATVKGQTDNTNSRRFIDQNVSHLRYVIAWKKWLFWTGKKWCLESGNSRVMTLAREFAESLWAEAADAIKSPALSDTEKSKVLKFVTSANDVRRIESLEKLSRHDNRVATSHRALDADPYLFNCLNGTLELKSMTFRPHQQEDLLTQVANVNYEPEQACPLWCDTMHAIFAGDVDLIRYVQTLIGYSISGVTDEHLLPIGYGEGNNGKSTLWNSIFEILGDYSTLVSQDLLLPNRDQHPTELASLFGKRFVAVAEPEQGRKLAEAKVKELTGDSVVKARRMKEDFWEFVPTHTFWLSTNHKPRIAGTDNGIWRRIRLIPFEVNLADVVKVDPGFPNKLRREFSGILNWVLEGWKRYQSKGLVEPHAVTEATKNYRNREDIIGEFIRENYVVNSSFQVPASEVYDEFVKQGGTMSQRAFGEELGKRFERERTRIGGKRTTIYRGFGTI